MTSQGNGAKFGISGVITLCDTETWSFNGIKINYNLMAFGYIWSTWWKILDLWAQSSERTHFQSYKKILSIYISFRILHIHFPIENIQ